MVLCFIAAAVLGTLALFSARYRPLAKEAFGCVFRKVTLRPCESNLDERLKSRIVAQTLDFSPAAARILNKYFEVFSWLLVILTLVSLFFFGQGLYNYWQYGNCNGPNSNDFCIFDPFGSGRPVALTPVTPGFGPTIGNGSTTIVEFGCFTCPSTRQAQQTVSQLLAENKIKLEFRFMPIAAHPHSHEAAEAAACALEQGKFWEYHDLLFSKPLEEFSNENFVKWAPEAGLNSTKLEECITSKRGAARVDLDLNAGKAAGIYGTPTFFIGSQSLVGPRPLAEFYGIINGTQDGGVCAPPAQ